MGRYLPYSRRELRRRFKDWTRHNWKVLCVLAIGAATLLVIETGLLIGLGSPGVGRWYLLGVLHAAVVAAFASVLGFAFLAYDREAILHLRGAWGEENTRSELERAKRKKLVWRWVDSVTLKTGDIDRLVVTRRGGLVAIDSKWRNQPDAADHQAMVRSANKANLRADAVVGTLWGAAQHQVPEGARIDGVEFIGGSRLISWLRQLEGDPVDADAARDALQRIEGFRNSAWSGSARS